MVARESVVEEFDVRQELAQSCVSVHRRATPKPNGLLGWASYHSRPNETAARHNTGTSHPVDGHRPKEVVPAAIVNVGNKNKHEMRVLPLTPSYRHMSTVCP